MAQNHGATLQGIAVDCSGQQAGFNIGIDTNYGTVIQSIVIPDDTQQNFSALADGLLPSTTYHVQAFVGDLLDGDKVFTTPADAPIPAVTTLDATNIF
jgi:hypothetical protein